MPSERVLLDGATGTELRARGVEVPDYRTSIWSAQALLDAPETVVAVHRDYLEAGADVITVNNYAVTGPLLARAGHADRLEELTRLAVDLACRARDAARRGRLAGSLPPLETSYRADLVGPDAELLEAYRHMAALLAPRVDLLLCETLSSAREASAAVRAARETGLPTWLSFTLQGKRERRLPSGESLAEAWAVVQPWAPDALLVNCCGANLVTSALPDLAASGLPFGGYAHAADVILAGECEAGAEPPEYEPLDVDGYAGVVAGWLDAGASIVGGCCTTGPAHIRALRALLDRCAAG